MRTKRQQAYDEYLQFSGQKQERSVESTNRKARMTATDFETDYDSEHPDTYDYYNNEDKADAFVGQRARYSARIDRFLNNGIIITGVLLLVVLAIAIFI